MKPSVAVISSHSALQILKGARDEGLETVLLCLKGRERLYSRYGLADKTIPIGSVEDLLKEGVQGKISKGGSILIPHGTLISGGKLEKFERLFKPRVFGNRFIFRWEFDRELKDRILKEGGIAVPKVFQTGERIDRPVIVKLPGAEGGRGYFVARGEKDLESKLKDVSRRGLIKKGEEESIFIQEYVMGVTLYPHFFYSPLSGELELLGCDRRYESSVDGLGRIMARDQIEMDLTPTFRVMGNIPIVLRESLLMDVFEAGEGFVGSAKKLVPPGMIGPFCLEMICDEDGKLFTFEFSGRIVAGTNLYVGGSPYSDLIYDEPMSMGRRIAREIKRASEEGQVDRVTT
jgi:5-formaminoimidazole-4-carboxamide-1-(beta)-D-ribofuranosyl 5'-monophosphate synthetase